MSNFYDEKSGSFANQYYYTFDKKISKNSLKLIVDFNDVKKAARELNLSELKLWLCLAKHKDGYSSFLFLREAEEFGLSKKSYYRAIEGLIEKGYIEDLGNHKRVFHSSPKEDNEEETEYIF